MFELRPCQEIAVCGAIDYIKDKRNKKNELIVAPVACGKSIIAAEIAKRSNGRLLIFAPKKELVQQNFDKYNSYGYANAGIYCAGLKRKEIKEVTFASIQSAENNPKDFVGFDNVLIDEAHGVSADSEKRYRKFLQYIEAKKVLGMTASPIRLYSNSYGASSRVITNTRPKFFHRIQTHIPVKLMVKEKYWSRTKYYSKEFDEKLLQKNSSGNDFTTDSMIRAIRENDTTNKIIELLHRRPIGDSVLVFAPTTEDAQRIAREVSMSGIITTKTKAKDRDSIVENFKNGIIKVLVNYNVFKEGFDFPNLSGIIVGRPSNSLAWWLQVVGRVVRKAEVDVIKWIMDFGGNYKRFGKIENIDIRKVQQKKGFKYEMFKGDILMSGIAVEDIGRQILKNGELKNIWVPNDNVVIPYTMRSGMHEGKAVRLVPLNYLEYLTKLEGCEDWIFAEVARRKK
jgi:DNA repair protein RadD